MSLSGSELRWFIGFLASLLLWWLLAARCVAGGREPGESVGAQVVEEAARGSIFSEEAFDGPTDGSVSSEQSSGGSDASEGTSGGGTSGGDTSLGESSGESASSAASGEGVSAAQGGTGLAWHELDGYQDEAAESAAAAWDASGLDWQAIHAGMSQTGRVERSEVVYEETDGLLLRYAEEREQTGELQERTPTIDRESLHIRGDGMEGAAQMEREDAGEEASDRAEGMPGYDWTEAWTPKDALPPDALLSLRTGVGEESDAPGTVSEAVVVTVVAGSAISSLLAGYMGWVYLFAMAQVCARTAGGGSERLGKLALRGMHGMGHRVVIPDAFLARARTDLINIKLPWMYAWVNHNHSLLVEAGGRVYREHMRREISLQLT